MTGQDKSVQPIVDQTTASAVYEATIRYQIKTWELAASTFCVEINGQDAEPALLQRLQPLHVKPASACKKYTRKPLDTMNVIDRKTKENSVIFDLETIHRVNQSEVDVDGGYVCASLCMAGGSYHVVWDSTGWHATGFVAHVMS